MSKRISILGAGESGTGAAILAGAKGFDVFVSDSGTIKDRYRQELTDNSILFEEGTHSEEKILDAELVIKSPGIPFTAPIVEKIKNTGIPVIDEIEFASRYIDGNIIAITGTNGKTTTTLLTYHLMKTAGFDVAIAGNVGESLARKVAAGRNEWYVLEISSFQLDGTVSFKPYIGVLLNITPDHLDRYQYSLQHYVDSKFRLIGNMTADDNFIYYADDSLIMGEIKKQKIVPRRIGVSLTRNTLAPAYFDGENMVFDLSPAFTISQVETTLRGRHNLIDTMAAVSVVKLAGGDLKFIRAGLKTFKNAPHRMERVGTINGVEFVNDSKATNVDAVSYALESYEQPLIWIAGGIDKGNDYSLILEAVKKKVRAIICLGKDNSKLKAAFSGAVEIIEETQSVSDLVNKALAIAQPGDVVLLSPACSSFDLFKNYEDRGDQFRAAVGEKMSETKKMNV